MRLATTLRTWAWPVVAASASAYPAEGQTSATFIAVALDADTRHADEALRRYLETTAAVSFVSEQAYEYLAVINRLVTWHDASGPFVARVTPYALVAAELLGADVQVLATYVGRATGGTTYQSYFVVSRERFPYEPELAGVLRYLREAPTPRRFVYHSEFSTSSYFLPALFFRGNDVFDMPEAGEHAVAIRARQLGSSSTDLVRAVARGEHDLAAVWSGTKAALETTDSLTGYARRVHFIPLPTTLPNDLLVASNGLDPATVAQLREAIGAMGPRAIDQGDFLYWRDLNAVPEAREALANLRWLAREGLRPATIDVQRADGSQRVPEAFMLAARQAVRLAGPEIVNYDRDFHAQQDYRWTLRPMHDGAVVLRSRIVGSDLPDQEFQISFRDPEDLSRRIGELFRSRLHRIRYLWPYRPDQPTILRDVDFGLEQGARVKVRRIRWLDVPRNYYVQEREFDAAVVSSDFHKFELAAGFIQPPDRDGFGFSPMGNISYRVLLVREEHELAVFRALTVALIVLLLVGTGVAVMELRRLVKATDFRTPP